MIFMSIIVKIRSFQDIRCYISLTSLLVIIYQTFMEFQFLSQNMKESKTWRKFEDALRSLIYLHSLMVSSNFLKNDTWHYLHMKTSPSRLCIPG